MSEIIPGLFLGSEKDSQNETFIEKNCIQCVLNSAEEVRQSPYISSTNYLHLKLDDVPTEKIDSVFPEAIEFISRCMLNDKAVLVHCRAGISRSATLVVAFLMFLGCDYKTAMRIVQTARPIVYPNEGFTKRLKKAEKELMNARTVEDIKKLRQ
jgi:dual specificity phosphatase 12